MEVWILMCDSGNPYEPDVGIWGVYQDESVAGTEKYEQEQENPEWEFWIERWRVEQ